MGSEDGLALSDIAVVSVNVRFRNDIKAQAAAREIGADAGAATLQSWP
jgi:hypothetical protein